MCRRGRREASPPEVTCQALDLGEEAGARCNTVVSDWHTGLVIASFTRPPLHPAPAAAAGGCSLQREGWVGGGEGVGGGRGVVVVDEDDAPNTAPMLACNTAAAAQRDGEEGGGWMGGAGWGTDVAREARRGEECRESLGWDVCQTLSDGEFDILEEAVRLAEARLPPPHPPPPAAATAAASWRPGTCVQDGEGAREDGARAAEEAVGGGGGQGQRGCSPCAPGQAFLTVGFTYDPPVQFVRVVQGQLRHHQC